MAEKEVPCDCVIDTGVRAGEPETGGRGLQPPIQKFLKMFGQNADDQAKVIGENILKGIQGQAYRLLSLTLALSTRS